MEKNCQKNQKIKGKQSLSSQHNNNKHVTKKANRYETPDEELATTGQGEENGEAEQQAKKQFTTHTKQTNRDERR